MLLNLTIQMERWKVLSFLSSNGKLVLLHKGIESLPKASKYDLVLSPQFYILKKEKLPVKYAFQAKKLAPSILEDLLPSDDYGYEYIVKKEGDSWLFFAYSPKEIEEELKKCCNIPPNKIGKIYFADDLKPILRKLPIGIDEYNALTLVDGKATIVPRSMLEDEKYAKFSNKLRPKGGFSFKPSSKANRDRELTQGAIVASILIVLLGVGFILDGINYKRAKAKEEAKLSALFEEFPQLQSKLTRDSIKNKYEAIEKRERKLRELLDTYSQLTSKTSILDKLELNKDKLIAQFIVTPSQMKKVESIAKGAKLKTTKVNNSLLRVEGVLK